MLVITPYISVLIVSSMLNAGTYQLMGTIMYLGPEWSDNFIHIEAVSQLSDSMPYCAVSTGTSAYVT